MLFSTVRLTRESIMRFFSLACIRRYSNHRSGKKQHEIDNWNRIFTTSFPLHKSSFWQRFSQCYKIIVEWIPFQMWFYSSGSVSEIENETERNSWRAFAISHETILRICSLLCVCVCVAKPVMFYHWKQLKYARDKKSSFQISFANKIQHHTTQKFNPNVCRAFCHSLSDVLFRCANKTRANPVCESVANSAKCWSLRITNNLKSSFIIITLTS